MDYARLFVIIDPTREEQPALSRAVALLRTGGGHIHVFCCVYENDFSPYSSRQEAERHAREQARQKLQTLVEPLVSDTITLEAEVDWNERWFESAIKACARVKADLLLKSTFSADVRSHGFSKHSDYHILRRSPCPVLLSKAASERPYQRVLAALALEDNDRKHDALNQHVMAEARKVCRRSGASLFAVAAVEGAPNITQILKITENADAEKLSDEYIVSQHFGIDPDKVIIDYGPATAVLVEAVETVPADLLIMGTAGRSGIAGAMVGNTCEKVLDAVSVDILTVT